MTAYSKIENTEHQIIQYLNTIGNICPIFDETLKTLDPDTHMAQKFIYKIL